MKYANLKKPALAWVILGLLLSVGQSGPRLTCQQLPPAQSKNPTSTKAEAPGSHKKPGQPVKPETEQEKKARGRAEQERQKRLKEQALDLANVMLEYNDLSDKVEGAAMKADFAALVCACGERERAVDVVRRSLKEAFLYAMQKHDDKATRAGRLPPEAALAQLAEAATRCDPASRKLIEADLAKIRPPADQSNGETTDNDPPVVADDLWGTKPSLRRSTASLLLVQAALDQIRAGRQADAENLLYQSLRYCVEAGFVVAVTRIKGDPVGVQALFLQAERQVASIPSGEEISVLDFGLPFMTGSSRYAGREAAISEKAADLDPTIVRLIGGDLDAVTALIQCSTAQLAAKSVDTIRMVKGKLPLYAQFRPDAVEQVQAWVGQAVQALTPAQQDIAMRVPSAAQHPADQASTIQEIAEKSDGDDKRRDEAYASLASNYIDSGKWDKAAESVAKISDIDLRSEMQDALSFNEISLAFKGEDLSGLSVRIDKMSSFRLRMRLYTMLGAAAFKKDPIYASSCLHQAEVLSTKLDRSPAQSHLLLDIARVYAEFDTAAAVAALHEAVLSINHHEDQPPTRWAGQYVSTTTVKYDSKFTLGRAVVDDPDEYKRKPYDLSVLRNAAEKDFDGALLEASSIGNKSIMAIAKYEVCAAILQKKDAAKQAPKPSGDQAPPPPISKDSKNSKGGA